MTPEIIALIISYTIKFGLPAGQAVVKLFQKKQVTQADWDELFLISAKSYDDYVSPKNPTIGD